SGLRLPFAAGRCFLPGDVLVLFAGDGVFFKCAQHQLFFGSVGAAFLRGRFCAVFHGRAAVGGRCGRATLFHFCEFGLQVAKLFVERGKAVFLLFLVTTFFVIVAVCFFCGRFLGFHGLLV